MYTYALYIDPNRPAPANFYLAESVEKAKDIISIKGPPERLHIGNQTPISFLEWLKENYYEFVPRFFSVHGDKSINNSSINIRNYSRNNRLELFWFQWKGEFRRR